VRALAVDFGFKKIGIAVGETEFKIAHPRQPIAASGALAKDALAIVETARKEQVDVVIVGLPVEESGKEGRMARICRTVGALISEQGFRVEFVDESYTSLEAETSLAQSRLDIMRKQDFAANRKKGSNMREAIHGEAAVLILERFQVEA
jgi:putative Holliday junction resolvase